MVPGKIWLRMGSSCLGWLGKTFLLENIHNRTHWINPNNLDANKVVKAAAGRETISQRSGEDVIGPMLVDNHNPSELTGNPLKCFIRSAGRVRRVLRLVCERNAGKM